MEHQEPTNPELDKAWELLKSAKSVEPSPFFSRNVVREVRRLEEESQAGWMSGLRGVKEFFAASAFRPVMVGGATCAVVALAAVLLSNPDSFEAGNSAVASSESATEEFDPATEMAEVEYFGQLMAVADPAMLDDASIANLFF